MSPSAPQDDVALVRCPGCGRSTLGSIPRCTHCKMELDVSEAPPAASGGRPRIAERCALCGEIYDGTAHDACPRCAVRFGQARREVLDRHHQHRQRGELVVWTLGAAALAGLGALAHWGASVLAPTFGAGTPLWLASVGGGLVMGALAGWRRRDRDGIWPSGLAMLSIAAATTFWLRAAVIWANGFNLESAVTRHPCEVIGREGSELELRCQVANEVIAGKVNLDADGDAVALAMRQGRLGYWVAAPTVPPPSSDADRGE